MNTSIVVIPTYNEVESIGVLLDALKLLPVD
ncbi:MAG: polyprenol monophosphomannose synthase, partial [Actinobacteria bacterium]|nr:polyprenol monophosphomannose synthase [Actinomycetota bacterium]